MYKNIFGKKIPVKYKKFVNDEQHDWAYYSPEKETIFLNEELKYKPVTFQYVTEIHEMFHALEDRLNIELPKEVSELLADTVAKMVVENYELKER